MQHKRTELQLTRFTVGEFGKSCNKTLYKHLENQPRVDLVVQLLVVPEERVDFSKAPDLVCGRVRDCRGTNVKLIIHTCHAYSTENIDYQNPIAGHRKAPRLQRVYIIFI